MSLTIGVDVGGTKVAAGVVDAQGKIIEQLRRATPSASPARTGQVIVEVVSELLIGPARAAFEKALTGGSNRNMAQIRLAGLGADAGIVGAADLARGSGREPAGGD